VSVLLALGEPPVRCFVGPSGWAVLLPTSRGRNGLGQQINDWIGEAKEFIISIWLNIWARPKGDWKWTT